MQRRAFVVASIGLVAGLGCDEFTGHDRIRVNGTVFHFTIEMGGWAIRGDDNVNYEPVGGLPAEFEQEGLRVRMVAKRTNYVSLNQIGPVVEIVSLSRL